MRIKQWVNYAVLFLLILLPWQTRWIFKQITFLGEPLSLGSLSFYATQILILALFLSVSMFGPIIHDRELLRHNFFRQRIRTVAFILLFVFLGLLAWRSVYPDLVLVHYSMIGFAGMLAVILLHPWIEKKTIFMGVSMSLVAPVLLGLYQVGMGSSAASTLFGLAARDAQVLGDSVFFLGGERTLRAYGSFPHPNIFAGYLLVGMWCAWQWLVESRTKVAYALFGLLAIGLIATGSQAAWLGIIFAGIWLFIEWRVLVMNTHRAVVLTGAVFLALMSIWLGASTSFLDRQEQYVMFFGGIELWDIIVGIGPLNYIFHLAKTLPGGDWWQYQPIHNAVLLVISEIGVIGSGLLSYLAWPRLKSLFTSQHFSLLLALVPPIFLDHYLWSTWTGFTIIIFLFSLDAKH
jgi:hypothetical protein